MKKITLFGTLLLLALSVSLAQDRTNPPDRSNIRARVLRELKLTDDQQKSIESLRFDMRKKAVDQQAKLKTAQLELAELFKADQPNQPAIQKKVGELSQLQSQQRLLLVDHWFAVNKLLTPDQQKIWKKVSAQLLAQRKARFTRGRAAQFMRNQRNQRRFAQPPGPMER
ncbi:MAG: periplasmic heavy metal sensor [Bacteroidota bacterium]|jgi:Spy/CpxP family protein refolding chaperone